MIRTNNIPRDILYWCELTDKQKSDLCHYDGIEDSSFFVYRNHTYDMSDFMYGGPAGWDGYHTDSFFSAVLVRYVEDYQRVVVGVHIGF